MISSRTATFRDLARVAGFINSLHLAASPIARLFTRQIHSNIQARSRWDCSFPISRLCQMGYVSGFLILKPLTDTGFNRSFPRVRSFIVMLVTMHLADSELD